MTGGEVVSWGSPRVGGDSFAVASQLRSDVISIFSNKRSFAALKRSGTVVTWGDRYCGGFTHQMSMKLSGRVQSISNTHYAFAALVCIPGGKMASTSNCTPCEPSEIWKDFECQQCEKIWEVPTAEQDACRSCGAGSVPNLPYRNECTGCPAFQKVSGSTLNITCEIDISLVLAVAGSILIAILLFCPVLLRGRGLRIWRGRLVKRALAKMRNHQKIYESFKSIHTLNFPMVLVKAETFLGMQGLISFETARMEHLLVFLDTIADISEFVSQHKVI